MIEIKVGGKGGTTTIVDDEDAWACAFSWTLLSTGYAYRRLWSNGRTGPCVLLHREIMGLQKGDKRTVDHANRDKLDNRRQNLRIASNAENSQNSTPRKGATSQFRGVYWHRAAGKWAAQANLLGKKHHAGLFQTETEAAAAASALRAKIMPFSFDDHKHQFEGVLVKPEAETIPFGKE